MTKPKLDTVVNIVFLVLMLIIGWVIVDNKFLHSTKTSNPSIVAGTRWTHPLPSPAKRHTLILALQIDCHFCNASMDYYKILTKLRGPNFDIVAVFPTGVSESKAHLKQYGVEVDYVLSAESFPKEIRGTPTMFLLDQNHIVQNTWSGKLPPEMEPKVLQELQTK